MCLSVWQGHFGHVMMTFPTGLHKEALLPMLQNLEVREQLSDNLEIVRRQFFPSFTSPGSLQHETDSWPISEKVGSRCGFVVFSTRTNSGIAQIKPNYGQSNLGWIGYDKGGFQQLISRPFVEFYTSGCLSSHHLIMWYRLPNTSSWKLIMNWEPEWGLLDGTTISGYSPVDSVFPKLQ